MSQSVRQFISFAILAGGLLLVATADAQFNKKGASEVAFHATGPAGLKFDGKTSELGVKQDANNVIAITVPLGNLTTGISLRDKHMKEKYLHVQQYPSTELRVSRGAMHLPKAGETSTGDTTGSLALHGQTRNVSFHYSTRREGELYRVTGSMRIDMTQFGIEQPSYLGVSVKKDVDITVRFDTQEE